MSSTPVISTHNLATIASLNRYFASGLADDIVDETETRHFNTDINEFQKCVAYHPRAESHSGVCGMVKTRSKCLKQVKQFKDFGPGI